MPSPAPAGASAEAVPAPGAPAGSSGAGGTGDAAGGGASQQAESHSVGEGDDASAATSRHGQGSLRNEYLREADRLVVGGDAVGRDKNVYLVGGKQRARLRLLATRLAEPIRDAFVIPDGFTDMRAKFDKSRTVILRGPAGYGKQGLAIRMLTDLSAGHVFHLDSGVDLARLAEWLETDLSGRDRIEVGSGFMLDEPADFANLYGSVLQGLEEALNRADARLVLTVSSDTPVPDRDLLDYIIDLTALPDCNAIVSSHLRYRLDGERAGQLLAREDIRDVITQQLATDASCKLAADLAEAIAEEADSPESDHVFDPGRIAAWKTRRGAENFDIWFAGLGDTRSRTFAIALAVLNGLPYDTVAKAARALYRRFDTPPYMVMASGEDTPPEGQRPFRISRREWLYRLHARIKDVQVRGVFGLSSHAEAVEYKDPDYATKVIRRAWSDYQAQDTLLGWLGELTGDGSEQVRIYASTALGRLATWSFDYLSRHVLGPWAHSTKWEQRDAVAYALRVAATDPRLRENVSLLITGWYADSGDPVAQATAARAQAVARGPADPASAFEALHRLAAVDDSRVAIAIGDSIADLLSAGTDEFACMVLPRLAASARDPQRSATTQLVFLILSDTLVTTTQPGDAGGEPASWPSLLHLTARLAGARSAIVSLWQYVLNDALFHREAEHVMTRWAIAAEGQPEVREMFLRLARQIVRGDVRSQTILARYAAQWVSDSNLTPLPLISAALQTVLAAERDAR